ncbi:MAG: type I restriction enzyme HsdR N-terminal domain-containing protein [Bacteroidales bacterium]|nr:type I restriction enzyme HsdR N-terminal domain-containing protein [Bacteroidales bacterium]
MFDNIKLYFPEFELKIIKSNNTYLIFDRIRKKYIKLTPEEYVRQNLVHYLIEIKKYPEKLISLEEKLVYANKTYRADLICYNNYLTPILIAECKSPFVSIDYKTLYQITNYENFKNSVILHLTNGIQQFTLHKINNKWQIIQEIPDYNLI